MVHWRHKKSIEGIVEQAHAVQARAQDLMQPKDTRELNACLNALEHSMDILRICVSALRHWMSLDLPSPVIRRKV